MHRNTVGKLGPMNRARAAGRGTFAILLLVTAGSLPRPIRAAGRGVAVIVNTQTQADNLSLAELRKVFLGERQFWTPRMRVLLLIARPGTPDRDLFLRVVYQMSEAQYRQYWIAEIMRAEVTSGPRTVASPQDAAELVAGTLGAIAFVPADQVGPGIKVLSINGKSPGQIGYPLQ